MKIITLLISAMLVLLQAEYTQGTSGIIKDNKTHLYWQDDYLNTTYPPKFQWPNAIQYCSELSLGGHRDWRLPNINELLSLMQDKQNPPMPPIFTALPKINIVIISSTTSAHNHSKAWGLYVNGGSNTLKKSSKAYVRCVRGGGIK